MSGMAFRKSVTTSLALASLSSVAPGAGAHHSPAPFDLGQVAEIEGVVTRFLWANPHVYIDVEVETPDGGRVEYEVEAAWPAQLADYGWSRDTLQPGDRIRVSGNPARNENDFAILGRTLSIEGDSQPLVLNAIPGTASPFDEPPASNRKGLSAESALIGAWQAIEDFTDAALFRPNDLLTDAGRAASEALAASNEGEQGAARCEPHMPPLNMVFQEAKSFERRGDDIVIRLAVTGDTERVIRMGNIQGAPVAADRQGFSRGRWAGDTLIVETTFEGIEDAGIGGITRIPADGTTLVESFALSEDRSRLEYSFLLRNPLYLADSLSASITWAYRDTPPPRLECDPEIASRFLDHASP